MRQEIRKNFKKQELLRKKDWIVHYSESCEEKIFPAELRRIRRKYAEINLLNKLFK